MIAEGGRGVHLLLADADLIAGGIRPDAKRPQVQAGLRANGSRATGPIYQLRVPV